MIETKILGDAVGVQRGDVIDNSETTVLPSLANGVVTGHFKRGRMDKPFKVTASNYKALLGYDPSNPSYLAVEDAFKRGISELSILRVGGGGGGGGGIKCVANFVQILPPTQESEVMEFFVTMSRNGGEFKTYQLNTPSAHETFAKNFFDSSGEKVVFFEYPFGAAQLPDSSKSAICGIDSEGMALTPDQGVIDLMDLELFNNRSEIRPPYTLTKQHNWLTFKPTDGVRAENDMFFSMVGGESGASTLTIHSCAVIEEYGDDGVIGCIPQSADIMFNSNYDESPIGNVHARYRVNNGNWIDYSNVAGSIGMGLIADFFNTIEFEGEKLIETSGNGGSDNTTVAPFRSYRGKGELLGASNSEPLSQDVWKIVTPKATTIEFVVTENTINDLVFLAFGQDTTVRSCADVIWEGL